MKNKFMRSVTAMVVAVTMLISSQGVVTSFADGGDYSDLSESSSVQMNGENNGETPQCNCSATEGESHKEGCPLYKPELPSCSCDAAEGEAHKEGCPLYVKPDEGNNTEGDAENGVGEDAADKAVIDMINDLPAVEDLNEETDLEALKTQISEIRAAYNALSDEQKETIDISVLTALETKISELESSNQETKPSEAVQNVIDLIDNVVAMIDHTEEEVETTEGGTMKQVKVTMMKDLDPANNPELKALIDKEAAHEQDETQTDLTEEEAVQLDAARKVFEDAKAKYLSETYSNAQLAARNAYDALATEEEKAQVTNYSLLEDMEANIAYIMQAVNTLPEGDFVAKIGDNGYTSLDEAVKEAAEGSTITLLKDCELTEGFNKTLTFNGTGKITIPKQLKSDGVDWMCFGLNNPSRVLTFDGIEVEWIADSSVPWLMLQLNGTLSVTNGAKLTFKFDSLSSGTRNALYMHPGAKLNVTNGSIFEILGENTSTMERPGQGIQLEKAGTASINVTDNSKFLIDGTNRGYVNSPSINVEDSEFTIQHCTSNASNGGNFTAINSKVTYQNNAGHGLSAGDVVLKNTKFLSDNNGLYGVYVSGEFLVDKDSTMTVTNNSYDGDCAGLNLTAGVTNGLVEAGAVVTITGNKCSGFSSRGVCTFKEGSKLTITDNINDKGSASYGGGVYNTKDTAHLILPSDAVIYNNHAVTGGDDIYNTGEITFGQVGNGWSLNGKHDTYKDCTDTIDGWYDDSAATRWKAHGEEPLHMKEVKAGTYTGELSLKAAHSMVNVSYEWVSDDNPTDVTKPANEKVPKGTAYTATAQEKTEQDYTFDGWYTDEACSKEFKDGTPLNADITLYGKWTKNINVSYEWVGPYFPTDVTKPANEKVPKGTAYTAATQEETKENYTFYGWYTDKSHNTPFKNGTVLNEDTILYGYWIEGTTPPGPGPDPDPEPEDGGEESNFPRVKVPVTIDDEDVPLADLPTTTIEDEEVPLKDIPNTGDMIPVAAMAAAALSLGGVVVLSRKRK